MSRAKYDEIRFAVPVTAVFARCDVGPSMDDQEILTEDISQPTIDFRLGLRWQLAELRISENGVDLGHYDSFG
jgi:hypothetical protein